MLVHIVELSTALLKADTKVINASLSQNQCLQCVLPATELNNDGMIRLGDVHYGTKQNRIYRFFLKKFNH